MAERTTSAEDTQNQHCQCVHTNVDRILQFLCNFLHSILDEDDPSPPICYTNPFAFFLVELALIGFQ